LLAAVHATAALGTMDSMIEWRWFDLDAAIYGSAPKPKLSRISVPEGPGPGIDPDPADARAGGRGVPWFPLWIGIFLNLL
jgi:hypothetical protein